MQWQVIPIIKTQSSQLKLLKISSLKAEQRQAVVDVLKVYMTDFFYLLD